MLYKRLFAAITLLFCAQCLWAQTGAEDIRLDNTTNTSTRAVPAQGLYVTDDNGCERGNYNANTDYSITLTKTCDAPYRLLLSFSQFDIGPMDTLYIYDGTSIYAPLIVKANNDTNSLLGERGDVYVTPTNTQNAITIRFRTGNHACLNEGFRVLATCGDPCEVSMAVIDSFYGRAHNGIIYDTAPWVRIVDTNGNVNHGINLCSSDDLVLFGHGVYSHNHNYYNPTDSTSTFSWDMGIDANNDGNFDVISGRGMNIVRSSHFRDTTGCFDIVLSLVDEHGCPATQQSSVKVRIASRPIRTIVDPLPPICSNDSLRLVIGSSNSATAHLVIDTAHENTTYTRTNNVRTFIPDGPNCSVQCYDAPVNFTEFPTGRTLNSANEICSICVNYEHEYMGDYDLKIVCPTNRSATLKYKNAPSGYPNGTGGGAGTMTGAPYGGTDHHTWDYPVPTGGGTASPHVCDSAYNQYGIGFDYCFSRNANYTLVDGLPANTTINGAHYLANSPDYIDNITITFPPRDPNMRNSGTADAGTKTFKTKHPSDHINKLDYYQPADNLATLVGCPLNGTWKIRICDSWANDNGWVFNWSLDICGINDTRTCAYDVNVDSVKWVADQTSGSWNNGYYRGPWTHEVNDSITYLYTIDTAGTFPVKVYVYDDFGCVWDTVSHIQSIWAPTPELGKDHVICAADSVLLTVEDPHATNFFHYEWTPTGLDAPYYVTQPFMPPLSSNVIKVHVTNSTLDRVTNCVGDDSVTIFINPQPMPNFDATIFPIEGCEPLTLRFINHSAYANKFLWDLGDGTTTDVMHPYNTYTKGVYGIKLYASNEYGCLDSVIYPGLIHVYGAPKADFDWAPVFPTISNPSIQLQNKSTTDTTSPFYTWEIQYNKEFPNSFQTVQEYAPLFTWNMDGQHGAGNYLIRLIAQNDFLAPSGNTIHCYDTATSTVLVIDDFLQFPSLVTPNGDGVNDRFVIINLIEGLAFPDNQLDIYDRWGKRVFSATNIQDPDDFWDPEKTNSPTGTYFFHFSASGYIGSLNRNGAIEVVR